MTEPEPDLPRWGWLLLALLIAAAFTLIALTAPTC